uniref:Serpentine type 7TM GPCR chemoreceptor Srx n=1 Tax=Schistocephalus solidus TaxID=70667 RepID=A0A0X3NHY0_SCHSO
MTNNTTTSGSVPCMQQEAWLGGPTYLGFLDYNRLILLSVLGLPVCVVGIFTSGLSICLFCRDKTTPRTTRKFLLVTSLIDVQFLLFSMLYLQPLTFCGRGCPLRRLYGSKPYVLPIFSFVNILECFRNWVVVLIGVERFLVICFPVRSKVWWNGKVTNRLIAACFGLSTLVRFPLISYLALENARPEWSRVEAWLYQIHSFTDSILVTLIPLSILIICSLQIGRGLRQSDRFRREQSEQQQHWRQGTAPIDRQGEGTTSNCSVVKRVKLTRGLLIVIVTFTLFMLPMVPVSIIQIISHHFFPSSCVYYVTLHICSFVAALGSQLNSTANFFCLHCPLGKVPEDAKTAVGLSILETPPVTQKSTTDQCQPSRRR